MTLLAIVLTGILLGVPPPEEVRRVVQDVFDGKGLQREWPDEPQMREPSGSPTHPAPGTSGTSGPSGPSGPRRPRPPAAPPGPRARPTRHVDGAGRSVSEALLWVAAVAGVLVVVAVLVRNRRARVPNVTLPAEAVPADLPVWTAPGPASDEADALAREGRFAEAVHVLLLDAFRRVGTRSPLDPSWTSREAAGHVRLGESAQAGIATLVRVVEVSRFGGRAVGEAQYREAREGRDRVVAAVSAALGVRTPTATAGARA